MTCLFMDNAGVRGRPRSTYEDVIKETARDLAACTGSSVPLPFVSAEGASAWVRAFSHKDYPALVVDKNRRFLLLRHLETAFEKALTSCNPAHSKSQCGHATLIAVSAYLSGLCFPTTAFLQGKRKKVRELAPFLPSLLSLMIWRGLPIQANIQPFIFIMDAIIWLADWSMGGDGLPYFASHRDGEPGWTYPGLQGGGPECS